jgi:hypothetical protein
LPILRKITLCFNGEEWCEKSCGISVESSPIGG